MPESTNRNSNQLESRFGNGGIEDLLSPPLGVPETVRRETIVRPAKSVYSTRAPELILSPALRELSLHRDRNSLIERLFESRRGIGPLIEAQDEGDVIVTYLYKGDEDTRSVTIESGGSDETAALTRFARSHIWYRSFRVAQGSYLSYTFGEKVCDHVQNDEQLVDVQELTDDLNPMTTPNGASLVCLRPLPAFAFDPPRGRLHSWRVHSQHLNSSRECTLYLPESAAAENCLGLIVFFDGEAFCLGWPEADLGPYVPTPQIMDALIREGAIPPVAAAFISVGDTRDSDLVLNRQFADAVAEEFIPAFLSKLGFGVPQARICVSGASYGGLCANFIGLTRPDVVGNVLAMSSSLWVGSPSVAGCINEGAIQALAKTLERQPVRFYIELGAYEGSEFVAAHRHLRDILKMKGYEITYRELPATHDYLHWQFALPEGLKAICDRWRKGNLFTNEA